MTTSVLRGHHPQPQFQTGAKGYGVRVFSNADLEITSSSVLADEFILDVSHSSAFISVLGSRLGQILPSGATNGVLVKSTGGVVAIANSFVVDLSEPVSGVTCANSQEHYTNDLVGANCV